MKLLKLLGQAIGVLGCLIFLGGLVWLRYFVLSFEAVGVSLSLIVVGLVLAVAGYRLADRENSRMPPSSDSSSL